MKKIFLFILSVFFFNSCGYYKNLEYKTILSIDELSGTYVDTIGNFKLDSRVSYDLKHIIDRDIADIYKYQFIDKKYLKISALTEKGFHETKTYKGKFNEKENYFEITIQKTILPLVIINAYSNIKERIGKDQNDDLLIDYRYESFALLLPLFGNSYDYQTISSLVKLKNVEYIPAMLGNKFGYVDPLGNILIEPNYDFARVFRNDVARVKVDNKWGLIDKKGNYIFDPQFDYISNMHEDSTALVVKDDHIGLIDKIGNEILPAKELEIDGFYKLKPNIYKITTNKKSGIYNSLTKRYIVEPIYDKIEIQYPRRNKVWDVHNLEPYYILSLNKEKEIHMNDTIVVPLTPKIKIVDIYSFSNHPEDALVYKKISDKIYALNIDFSNTPITLDDIYPFYVVINKKSYLIDHKNNYYEIFTENETIKMAFKGISPRKYIENKSLTYEQVTERSREL